MIDIKKMMMAAVKIQKVWRAKMKKVHYELLRNRKWRILDKLELESCGYHFSIRLIERLPIREYFLSSYRYEDRLYSNKIDIPSSVIPIIKNKHYERILSEVKLYNID
jgi:hypothetical protein